MPSTLRKRRRLLTQPTPIGWFDLPAEMREMVIDKMDPKTRCRFAQCSKLCEKEAKESNNYLYKIGVYKKKNIHSMYPELHISFSKESKRDVWYEFIHTTANQTIVVYKCNTTRITNEYEDDGTVKWTKVELGRPEDVRLRYLKKYLEKCKNNIRLFKFEDRNSSWSGSKLDITQLKRLEGLCIPNCGFEKINENGFIDMKQFSRLKYLETPELDVTFDQFLKFNGEKCCLYCPADTIELQDLLKYLKMRQNEQIHENLQCVEWRHVNLDTNAFAYFISELNGYNYSGGRDYEYDKFSFRSNTVPNREFIFLSNRDMKLEYMKLEKRD